MKLKIIICLISNITLLILFLVGFREIRKHNEIVSKNNPIEVKIIKINHSYKSSTTCSILFKGKKYENVHYPFNEESFYYDSENDEIFYKNDGKFALRVIFILFILSLFLWIILKEKFKLSYS